MTRWLRHYAGSWFGRWFGYVAPEDTGGGRGRAPRKPTYAPPPVRYIYAESTIESEAEVAGKLFANVAIEALVLAGSWIEAAFQRFTHVPVYAQLRRGRRLEAEIGFTGRYQSEVDEEEALLLALLMRM
jgi:hypothetical protein